MRAKSGPADDRPFGERLAADAAALPPAVRRVVQFIDRNRTAVLASSAMEIAASTGTSDATVVRAAQALGYPGLGALKQGLLSAIDPQPAVVQQMRMTLDEVGASTLRAVDLILAAHDDALATLRLPASKDRLARAVAVLHPAARIVTFGIGPSATMASYASILLGRSGRRTRSLDCTGLMLADQLLDLRSGDALVAIAYRSLYREVAAVFGEAKRLQLPVVLVTDTAEGKLARAADVVLPTPRGRAGRIASHGATLIVLEALVLGLAAANGDAAVSTLGHLNDLRRAVAGTRDPLG